MQDRPFCFACSEAIPYDAIFEAPCGHDDCPSVVFHGLCLMEWREARSDFVQHVREVWKRWVQEHGER